MYFLRDGLIEICPSYKVSAKLQTAGGSYLINSLGIPSPMREQRFRDSGARAFVKRLTMLITSDGRWVLEDSAEFLEALGDPHPDYDAALFAVKNLGFIKFQILDGSVVEIDLHPRNVQLPALLAVQQQLLSSQVRLFRIKYFDTAWRSEIMTSAEPAISRL